MSSELLGDLRMSKKVPSIGGGAAQVSPGDIIDGVVFSLDF